MGLGRQHGAPQELNSASAEIQKAIQQVWLLRMLTAALFKQLKGRPQPRSLKMKERNIKAWSICTMSAIHLRRSLTHAAKGVSLEGAPHAPVKHGQTQDEPYFVHLERSLERARPQIVNEEKGCLGRNGN